MTASTVYSSTDGISREVGEGNVIIQNQVSSVTFMQFLVLSELSTGSKSGKELRKRMESLGQEKSPTGFYQFMDRMGASGMVMKEVIEVNYENKSKVREREYSLTQYGLEVYSTMRNVLSSLIVRN